MSPCYKFYCFCWVDDGGGLGRLPPGTNSIPVPRNIIAKVSAGCQRAVIIIHEIWHGLIIHTHPERGMEDEQLLLVISSES